MGFGSVVLQIQNRGGLEEMFVRKRQVRGYSNEERMRVPFRCLCLPRPRLRSRRFLSRPLLG